MPYQTIEVKKLTPVIGAEIHGVDLAAPLGNQTFQEIHDALMENLVIFFRDQAVTVDQHKAFGRRFGELHHHPAAPALLDGHPEILVIHADASSKRNDGGLWHSDVSCELEPPMGSILHIQELPEVGGDTLFASTYAAFEALSERMQNFLSGLIAEHGSDHLYRGRYRPAEQDAGKAFPAAEHPVVRTHPVTGRKGLFVNSGFTVRIKEMKPAESRALLDFLFDHMATPEFQCRFRWAKNSIAFWDNRCTQHFALWDYFPAVRHGNRVTIKGDRPFYAG